MKMKQFSCYELLMNQCTNKRQISVLTAYIIAKFLIPRISYDSSNQHTQNKTQHPSSSIQSSSYRLIPQSNQSDPYRKRHQDWLYHVINSRDPQDQTCISLCNLCCDLLTGYSVAAKEENEILILANHRKTCQSKNLYLTYANTSDINMMKNDARKPNNFDYYLD